MKIKKLEKLDRFKIYILVMPLIITLIIEIAQRYGLKETVTWILYYPGYFILSLLLVYSMFIAVSLLTEHFVLPFLLVFLPLVLVGIINAIKIQFRETPILPWNALLLKEIGIVFKLIGDGAFIVYIAIGIIVLIIAGTVITYRRFGIHLPKKIRKLGAAVSLLVCAICIFISVKLGYQGNLLQLYLERGMLPAAIAQFSQPMMEVPEPPYKGNIGELYTQIENQEVKPDIIAVMLEAFTDPNTFSNLEFSSDPVPNYNKIKKNSVSGYLSVNAYGGNTSCTEFEFLTGLSSTLTAPEITGYLDVLKKPVPGLAHSLNLSGYQCIAVHPFYRETLGRSKAYEILGFREFVDINSFDDTKIKGKYISDEAAGDKIIELYERERALNRNDPLFIFSVTIQNHYDYKLDWYGADPEISVKLPDNMPLRAGDMLKGYVQGVFDSDKLIGKLTDYFASVERPTVLVFFGDHLPGIDGGAHTYAKAGLISSYKKDLLSDNGMMAGISREDLTRMHSTPFIIWDNYKKINMEYDIISPCYLPSVLSDLYGYPCGKYFDFLSDIFKKVPNLGLSSWPDYQDYSEEEKTAVNTFKAVQYGILNGNSH